MLALPRDAPGTVSVATAARRGVRGTWETLKEVWRTPPLRWFLLAYFLFMDGVETVIVFAGPYARGSLNFSKEQALLLFAVVQITALVGSLATAKTTDVRGPRFTVAITLVWWVIVVVGAFLATTQLAFWIVAGLAGLGLGAVQSAARALMARLVPEGREAEMFGFMALCGRTGSILGPLVFGWVAVATDSQRAAVLSVAPFFVLGLLLLSKVREERTVLPAPAAAHDA
jgi:UMF1 family MFS transporter